MGPVNSLLPGGAEEQGACGVSRAEAFNVFSLNSDEGRPAPALGGGGLENERIKAAEPGV